MSDGRNCDGFLRWKCQLPPGHSGKHFNYHDGEWNNAPCCPSAAKVEAVREWVKERLAKTVRTEGVLGSSAHILYATRYALEQVLEMLDGKEGGAGDVEGR